MISSRLMATIWILAAMSPAIAQSDKALEFGRDVRPILANHCLACHGFDESSREAGLRLDLRESATATLKSGRRAIVPGKPAESELIARIDHDKPSRRMPPPEFKKPITEAQRAVLRRWIEEGASFSEHWAFVAPKRVVPPAVKSANWPINPIDNFILHRLERKRLHPSPPAPKETLLRRVALDLTGLPPNVDELDVFLSDPSPMAYEKAVDRLLASPRYAEKMAVAWLDLARYADTNGYNNDAERTMWPWRDWVLRAFNANLPYDRFLVEQLAGDPLPGATAEQKLATGFNRNHGITTEGGIIPEEYRVEYVADRVHTASTTALALSFQCARCHEHKYDPISQKEYYEFFGFFNNIEDRLVDYNQPTPSAPFIPYLPPETADKLADVERAIAANKLGREGEALAVEKARLEKSFVQTMVMEELPKRRETFVLKRGQYDQRGEKVEPGLPGFLPPLPKDAPANRLGLARWLVEPSHPLTARVAVNRWWASYFGVGIVETVEDFGLQGDLPSHPELLDWLATELIRTNWDVKAMQKMIVTSATYRQSSRIEPEHLAKDPKNRLLARSPRYRLPAESVRDNALAISGLLKNRFGGPSVKPYQPPGLWEEVAVERRHTYVPDKGDNLYRRGIYTFWRRTIAPPGMTTFDAPNREYCVPRRAQTNTPLQALILQNDPTYVEAARVLAERMMEAETSDEARLRYAMKRAVARDCSPQERAILLRLYEDSRKQFQNAPAAAAKLLAIGNQPRNAALDAAELAAWTSVASTILNMDETISRP